VKVLVGPVVAELREDERCGFEGVVLFSQGIEASDDEPVGPLLAKLGGVSLDRFKGDGTLGLDRRYAFAGVKGLRFIGPDAPAGVHGDSDTVKSGCIAEVPHPEEIPHALDEVQRVLGKLRAVCFVNVHLRATLELDG